MHVKTLKGALAEQGEEVTESVKACPMAHRWAEGGKSLSELSLESACLLGIPALDEIGVRVRAGEGHKELAGRRLERHRGLCPQDPARTRAFSLSVLRSCS